ncbi:protein kinase family protein [Gloeocapsa sp. PCC 73106]|nr:protein kinase family protein [Gloeocapsa sp. PCC 73106]
MDRLSLRDIKKIAVAILEILVYLQEQNPSIIHRDIKPENILVTKDLQILEQ